MNDLRVRHFPRFDLALAASPDTMEEPWDFEFLSRIADSCLSFLSEFVDDWLANDMRVSIFKILLSWLIFSLIAIHFVWKVYGNTVNDMYYRQGGFSLSLSAPHNDLFHVGSCFVLMAQGLGRTGEHRTQRPI